MKLTIERKKLMAALTQAGKVASARGTLPVLSCVRLVADGLGGYVEATNLDQGLRVILDGLSVQTGGKCCVAAARLLAAVKGMTGETVSMRHEKSRLTASCGDREVTLHTLPAEEFPDVPTVKGAAVVLTPEGAAAFIGVLGKVVPFASHDETRYVLNGTHLAPVGERLHVVATDGRRLAEASMEAENWPNVACTLPVVGVRRLGGLPLGDSSALEVTLGENNACFSTPEWALTCKLIEGNFPNYNQVIPKPSKVTISANRLAVLGALSFVQALADKSDACVKLFAEKGRLKLSMAAPEIGEAHDEVSAELAGIKGSMEVAFNAAFLREALSTLRDESVVLDMADPQSPLLLREEGFTTVLMPMRWS